MKKKLSLALLFGLLLFVGTTHFAHAVDLGSLFNISDLAYTVIGKICFGISYLISVFAAIVIAIETWLIDAMLSINTGVFQSPIVQNGFAVTLSIANLCFVLGIIVIAIATILRRETYGIKKTLWKLVVAAILVNFSLVIMAPIFGFANSLTQYFVNCIDTGGGCNNVDGATATNDFAMKLAGAFNPQKQFISINSINKNDPSLNNVAGAAAVTGSNFGQMIVPILSLLFTVISLIVIVIVLAVFVFMLLIRYIYIAILAVLMPFAWVSWPFPGLSKHWSTWWNTFIRWTLFAPIVVFFLWLMLLVADSMSKNTGVGSQNFSMYVSTSTDPAWKAISDFFTNGIFAGPVQNLLNMFILVGLMVGGMIAANKMSITGASVATGAVTAVGKSIQGYVGKETKKGARWTYQRAGGRALNERLQRSRVPLASTFGRGLANITEGGGKDLVKKAATNLKVGDMSDDDLKRAVQGAKGNDNTLATLAEAQKRGKLNILGEVGGEKDLNTWMDKNERVFEDYDHGKLRGDINTSLLSDERGRRIAKAQGEANAAARATATVVDTHGILGSAGAQVSAEALEKESAVQRKRAEDAMSTDGPNAIVSHMGRNVNASILAKAAANSSRNADVALNEAGENVMLDEEGRKVRPGGPAGRKAGDLMREASEKFFSGVDKSDIAKSHPEQMFDGKANFGLTKEAIDALSRGIAHGMAVETPTLTPSMIHKLDSSERLQRFFNSYEAAIQKAATPAGGGKFSAADVAKLMGAFKKTMANRLVFDSGSAPATPTPAPAPAPTPAPGGAPHS